MSTIHTPWGPSQSQREHAPGIVFHSTASHGGYLLSDERYAEFRELPHFANWDRWLEEDCDAALVYLRWPELATDEQIHDAIATARAVASWGNGRWITLVEGWLDQPEQQSLILRAQQHAKAVRHLWQRSSMCSQGNGWHVNFVRGAQSRTVTMDYPTKRYYTDEELNALDDVVELVVRDSHEDPWVVVGKYPNADSARKAATALGGPAIYGIRDRHGHCTTFEIGEMPR